MAKQNNKQARTTVDEVNETPVVYHWKYKMEDFGTSIGVAN